MDFIGCLQRVEAKSINRHGKTLYVRSIKYIGEPSEQQRLDFVSGHKFARGADKDDAPEEDDAEDGNELEDAQAAEVDLASAVVPSTSQSLHIAPQVDLQQPMLNFIRDLVESAGSQGLSSMVCSILQVVVQYALIKCRTCTILALVNSSSVRWTRSWATSRTYGRSRNRSISATLQLSETHPSWGNSPIMSTELTTTSELPPNEVKRVGKLSKPHISKSRSLPRRSHL